MNVPIFGKKLDGKEYQLREGAYTLVLNERREVLLVSPPNGAYFLPGGEIENQETNEETLHRECMEELGCQITIGEYLGQADEYFYSSFRDTYYDNPGYFYVTASWQQVSEPLEDFNTLEWMSYDEAILKLKRGSHRWALKQYFDQ